MATFESTVRQIPYSQQSVYGMLCDLNNINKVKDRIPADKLNDLSFDADSLSLSTPMGAVRLRIVDREEPKCIKFATEESPLAFNFWIQILPVTENSSKMKLTIKAELNPFIKGMVSKPLQEGLEKIADALQMIRYE
ncbi:MAG: SRPBCC family protein [Prevotella sp.]